MEIAKRKQDSSPFRPHTHAALLGLIKRTLPTSDDRHSVLMPVTKPKLELAALLALGRTVQWCWTTWDDERVVDYDTVLSLVSAPHTDSHQTRLIIFQTVTWLYHLGQNGRFSGDVLHYDWHSPLLTVIATNSVAAGIVIAASFNLSHVFPYFRLIYNTGLTTSYEGFADFGNCRFT